MKKKRKYTRHEKVLDAPQSDSTGIDKETGVIVPIVDNQGFSFNDLPLSIRTQVENTIKMRERLRLPDDPRDRKAMAIKMFRGDRLR